MNFDALPADERFLDLISLHLADLLSAEQEQDLARLLADRPNQSLEAWEKLAAVVALATSAERFEPLPSHLHEKLLANFIGHGLTLGEKLDASPARTERAADSLGTAKSVQPAKKNRLVREWGGWLAAAACLVLALIGWMRHTSTDQGGGGIAKTNTLADERAELLALAKQPTEKIVHLDWTATPDPAAAGARGDVVWDNAHQKGYMLFHGLAKNDPKLNQYQLWIFDKEQDERYPIDGGVFDIDDASGDIVVPIRAKLAVKEPTLFAITVEKPGGVVVSSRQRLPLLAKLQ